MNIQNKISTTYHSINTTGKVNKNRFFPSPKAQPQKSNRSKPHKTTADKTVCVYAHLPIQFVT